MTKCFFPTESLLGQIVFDNPDASSFRWKTEGMSEPVRIANVQTTRIERNNKRISRLQSFDVKMFPHLLHLKNGEVLPCRILSYDGTSVNFRSPFVSAKSMNSENIKAVEFTREKTHGRKENRNPITITGGDKHRIILEDGRILEALMDTGEDGNIRITVNTEKIQVQPEQIKVNGHIDARALEQVIIVGGDLALNEADALKRGVELMFDPLDIRTPKLDGKVERALTIPRFNRENPPKHILVANNGDLMRGELRKFNGETIQFESKLKQIVIPINRVARIIDISTKDIDTSENADQTDQPIAATN